MFRTMLAVLVSRRLYMLRA